MSNEYPTEWVLVPKTLTPGMRREGSKALMRHLTEAGRGHINTKLDAVWGAMMKEAPRPPNYRRDEFDFSQCSPECIEHRIFNDAIGNKDDTHRIDCPALQGDH